MYEPPELVAAAMFVAWAAGSFFGAGVTILVQWATRRKDGPAAGPAAATTGADGELRPTPAAWAEMTENLEGLEKQTRMLAGRLNRVDPPRKGTGEAEEMRQDAPGSTIGDPLGTSDQVFSRSTVLRTWRKRRGL